MSPVPIDSKFYGEKESDNQIIDLYRKFMIFDQNSTENRGPTEACLGENIKKFVQILSKPA